MTSDVEEIKKWLKEHLDLSHYRVGNELISDLRLDGETIAVSYIRGIKFEENIK